MAAKYPNEPDELRTDVEDRSNCVTGEPSGAPAGSNFHAKLHNDANAAINAIEETLGDDPQGAEATVAAAIASKAGIAIANTFTQKNIFRSNYFAIGPNSGDTPSGKIPINTHAIINGPEAVADPSASNTIGWNQTITFTGDFTGITGANAGTLFGQSVFATTGIEAGDGKGIKVVQGTSLAGVIKGEAPSGLEVVRGAETSAEFYGSLAKGSVGQMESLRVVGPKRGGGATEGKVTGTAYTLFITEPTIEATNKFSLFVEGGVSRFGGTIQANNTINNAAGSGSLSIFGSTSKATGAVLILQTATNGGKAIFELEKSEASLQITNGTTAKTVFDNTGKLRLSNIETASTIPATGLKHKLPIYNVTGELQGYIPIYETIT
jgi:hypothetical protein